MAYVVAEPCINCKFTDCVDVCPVDCFYEGKNILVIHPEECIDCGACEPECPVDAIFEEDEVPDKWRHYVEINAQYSPKWPGITSKKPQLPTAEEFRDNKDKGSFVVLEPAK